ncbi:MAG: FtsQ-type POTRA domain-containing protein [Puniceicoccales bacterium]|jgi:hypothetical protein|nr:FtsQ-type POTRA domain-containing protein [Puniceicoccales bacterium]
MKKREIVRGKEPRKRTSSKRSKKSPGGRKKTGLLPVALLLAVGCLLALFAAKELRDFIGGKLADGHRLERIEIATTGTLPRSNVIQLLKIPRGASLGAIDIVRCRNNLLKCPQVRDAHVERAYPHTIRVKILERTPVFKLFSSREKTWLFVAEDGFVFTCAGVDPSPSTVPQLNCSAEAGTTLFFVAELCRIMEEARSINGPFVESWTAVSVDEANYSRTGRIDEFEVRCGSIAHLRLRSGDLVRQFAELEYVLTDARERHMLPLEKVDLSIRGRAYVKPMARGK